MTKVDGRVARGERTRQAVVEALLALYEENNLTPTIDDIASRVGMTARTIYHHFDDHEAIAEALREHQRPLMTSHMAPLRTGTLDERIDAIVDHRMQLFAVIAPVRRAALANMHRSARIRKGQAGIARRLRQQIATTFEAELEALDENAAAQTVEALDLHLSFETWDRLRRTQRLSEARTKRLITGLLRDALTS